jgi:hypothetical protein
MKDETKPLIPKVVRRYREIEVDTYDCPVCKGCTTDTLEEIEEHMQIPVDTPLPKGFIFFGGINVLGDQNWGGYRVILTDAISGNRNGNPQNPMPYISGGFKKFVDEGTLLTCDYNPGLAHGLEQTVAKLGKGNFDKEKFGNIRRLMKYLKEEFEKFRYVKPTRGLEVYDSIYPSIKRLKRVNSKGLREDLRNYKNLQENPRILHPKEFEIVSSYWKFFLEDARSIHRKAFNLAKGLKLVRTTPEIDELIKRREQKSF